MATRNDNGAALNEEVETHEDGSQEWWRDVIGYEGRYRVSDWGRVKSVDRAVLHLPKNRAPYTHNIIGVVLYIGKHDRTGHCHVYLTRENRLRKFKVHRLVLESFVGPPPKGTECRHFPDRDTANNRLENLQWGTKKENASDKAIHGTEQRGEEKPLHKLTEQQVLDIRSEYASGGVTMMGLAEEYKVSDVTIFKAIRKKTWRHI